MGYSVKTMRVLVCHRHPVQLPPGHRLPGEKYALLRSQVVRDGVLTVEELTDLANAP
jgi:hypothetical protein